MQSLLATHQPMTKCLPDLVAHRHCGASFAEELQKELILCSLQQTSTFQLYDGTIVTEELAEGETTSTCLENL